MSIRCLIGIHKWPGYMEPCDLQLMANKSPFPVKFRKCLRCSLKRYYTRGKFPETGEYLILSIGDSKESP